MLYSGYAHIHTIGCQMNVYDSEKLGTVLHTAWGINLPGIRSRRMSLSATPVLSDIRPKKKPSVFWGGLPGKNRKDLT